MVAAEQNGGDDQASASSDSTVRLGIQLRVTDLTAARAYFEKLGFSIVAATTDQCFATADTLIIRITTSAKLRTGLLIEDGNHEEGFLLDPDGNKLYSYCKMPKLESGAKSICGSFMGLALEVLDLDRSIEFYGKLGLNIAMGGIDQGWVSLSSGVGPELALMKVGSCPHLFLNPSVSYFNGKHNLDIINGLREAGVRLDEELTVFSDKGEVDNVILVAPGGMGFFIFSD